LRDQSNVVAIHREGQSVDLLESIFPMKSYNFIIVLDV
jgi:hypothetical protein